MREVLYDYNIGVIRLFLLIQKLLIYLQPNIFIYNYLNPLPQEDDELQNCKFQLEFLRNNFTQYIIVLA